MFDLAVAEDAYLFGLLQTDGTHAGSPDGKGRVSIELARRDEGILHTLAAHLDCYSSVRTRSRETNFSGGEMSDTVVLRFYDQAARQSLTHLGLPPGRKAQTAVPPVDRIAHADYLRGLLDGDGSLGFTARGYPFVSFVTASEPLARFYEGALQDIAGVTRSTNRNKRDRVFNILVTNAPAVTMARYLYYDGAIALARKAKAAAALATWTPPSARFGVTRRAWSVADDAVVLAHHNAEAAALLGRTVQSVNVRRWRLTNSV